MSTNSQKSNKETKNIKAPVKYSEFREREEFEVTGDNFCMVAAKAIFIATPIIFLLLNTYEEVAKISQTISSQPSVSYEELCRNESTHAYGSYYDDNNNDAYGEYYDGFGECVANGVRSVPKFQMRCDYLMAPYFVGMLVIWSLYYLLVMCSVIFVTAGRYKTNDVRLLIARVKFNSTKFAVGLKYTGFGLSFLSLIVGYVTAMVIGNLAVAANPISLILFCVTNCIAIESIFGESFHKNVPKLSLEEDFPKEVLYVLPESESLSISNLYGALISSAELMHIFEDALLEYKHYQALIEKGKVSDFRRKVMKANLKLPQMGNLVELERAFSKIFLEKKEENDNGEGSIFRQLSKRESFAKLEKALSKVFSNEKENSANEKHSSNVSTASAKKVVGDGIKMAILKSFVMSFPILFLVINTFNGLSDAAESIATQTSYSYFHICSKRYDSRTCIDGQPTYAVQCGYEKDPFYIAMLILWAVYYFIVLCAVLYSTAGRYKTNDVRLLVARLKFNSTRLAVYLKCTGYALSVISLIVGFANAIAIGTFDLASNLISLILFCVTNCVAITALFGETLHKKIPTLSVTNEFPSEILYELPKSELSIFNLYGALIGSEELMHMFVDALLEYKHFLAIEKCIGDADRRQKKANLRLVQMGDVEMLEATFEKLLLEDEQEIEDGRVLELCDIYREG